MNLAAQDLVKLIGVISVHLHLGFAHLQGKRGAKLPWVLHLAETINTSESRSDLELKIWTSLFLGYTVYAG